MARIRERRREGDRGAVLIEAALVFPLLMLLVFGIMEYGLMFRTTLSISESTRAGARVAAAHARQTDIHDLAVSATSGTLASASIPGGSIEELIVYEADADTGLTVNGLEPEDCTTNCIRYTWSSGANAFTGGSGTWTPTSMSACGDVGNTDYYGVYVRARYDFITGFFGESVILEERSVMRLEPLPVGDGCEP